DIGTEMMLNYSGSYQAPYRTANVSYEPAGDGISDGSNLPDYVTFCTTCHNASNAVYSTERAGNLKFIDWTNGANGDKHGLFSADGFIEMQPNPALSPYISGDTDLGYVLSCLDCHEPHGSGNIYLLRGKVNGQVTGAIATGFDYRKICGQCHDPDWETVHHLGIDKAYTQFQCLDCHSIGSGDPLDCGLCHFHGAVSGTGTVTQTNEGAQDRKAF
ncbi:MAG: cytochrome c3 family protein, partial [Desulfobulbaceae bacterium]|nr:cytochrome c3 family protein [Desulfobulbaceae bacterium]